VSTARCSLEPFFRLAPSWPARALLSGVECKVRLSRIATLCCVFLPAASRSTAPRSSASASKHPAASQRCVRWYTAAQGSGSLGSQRQGAPVFTTQRSPLNTSRSECSRCPACSGRSVSIGRDQQPFFIRHIGWLRLAGSHAVQPDRYQARGS
jgi:hypothetical protein